MRTSLNNIKLIDDHLHKQATPEDALLFDALLIIDPELPQQITWQKKVNEMVQLYSRKKLKAEIAAVHQKLFSEAEYQTFRQRVMAFFG